MMKYFDTFLYGITCLAMLAVASLAKAEMEMYFIHNDHLGTPAVITDKNQVVVWEGKQKPFGKVEVITNTLDSDPRFPGQHLDKESGLHYNYFRDYDPTIGRYIQSDPMDMVDGPNTYAYVKNNPINRMDPLGLWSTSGHNYYIDNFYGGLNEQYRNAIKQGSKQADGAQYQFGNSAHMHAMGNGVNTAQEQCQKMQDYVAHQMAIFNRLKNASSSNPRARNANKLNAYKALGRAMHPVMDSTSPAHIGWQIWQWNLDTVNKHGDFSTSLENLAAAQNPVNLANTMAAMRQASNGSFSCSCQP